VAADPPGDLHDPGNDVDAAVVLVARVGDLVQDNELVAAELGGDVLLALGAGADDLVALELGHLGGPLAGAAADPVDEHPLALLDEARVRVGDEVVGRHALHDARDGGLHGHRVGHREQLGRRDRRELGVAPEHRVRDAVAHLVTGLRRLGRHLRDGPAALLPPDERQVARVQALAVVPGRVRGGGVVRGGGGGW
jgi:hypothetical protein